MTDVSRPLHLHTLESLCTDLVAGLSVVVGDSEKFQLQSEAARGVLAWYARNRSKWAANLQTVDAEAIVDAAGTIPVISENAGQAAVSDTSHQFTLRHIKAHQFAGLHHAGTAKAKPADFEFEFKDGVTLYEGYNGCGKTSLLNAIIWALTGEMLRPQRPPEPANKDFDFEVEDTGTHAAPPVVPLPDPAFESVPTKAIPVDTWVELQLEDQNGKKYLVRRSLKRVARDVLKEDVSGINELGLDPVSTRVGTTMPGILPYVQVGSASALGKAVSELTGMAPLVHLANHATKAKKKIEGDLTKGKKTEIQAADEAYFRSRTDLLDVVNRNQLPIEESNIPTASEDVSIETKLGELSTSLEKLKADGLAHAKQVLGEAFDAQEPAQRTNLIKNIEPAINVVSKLGALPSMHRLSGLTKLTSEEVASVQTFIEGVRAEAVELLEIAADPDRAARLRLYSRVAAWIKDHPSLPHDENFCAVCGQDIVDVVDDITGGLVKDHINAAAKQGDFAGKTFSTWAKHVLGEFATKLPAALVAEAKLPPPEAPTALIRKALVEELFQDPAFSGSLKSLSVKLADACDLAFEAFPVLEFEQSPELGNGREEFRELNQYIQRIERGLAHPKWRAQAKDVTMGLMRDVVGQVETDERKTEANSLMGQLLQLRALVTAIEPLEEASAKQKRMLADIEKRRIAERRLKAYDDASQALQECIEIGGLAERQVAELQSRLHTSATHWRNKIYLSAFPATSMELVDSRMSGSGDLQLLVGAPGVAAPAQHVSNASALRASLLAFYLAYWQYMLKERGGLRLMVLDDPQELLDGDNRDRLAEAIHDISRVNAQLVITSHDTRFAMSMAKRLQAKETPLHHYYVHPATAQRGTIFLTPSMSEVQRCFERFKSDPNDPSFAQAYLSECRIFIEGRMGDLFDNCAYPAAATVNFSPTLSDHLSRLRSLVKNAPSDLFKSVAITSFVNDPALRDGSPTLVLLNKSHHRDKSSIRPAEVYAIRTELERLRQSVERAHEEFRNFNRREPIVLPANQNAPLSAGDVRSFRIPVVASLKAFVRDASHGDSQETEVEEITSDWFRSKAFFYVRANTLGFAAPQGSIAIVDVDAAAPGDRQLVIARAGRDIYARRLLKPEKADFVALAAETPDPRKSPPTQLLREQLLALHPIDGILFGGLASVPVSKSEAVQVNEVPQLEKVKTAYRIKEESAIPLALPGQIALGGAMIPLDELDAHIDKYVALHLDDGTNLFKRVGERFPEPLQHLRQFETIGGLGVADVLAVGTPSRGFKSVMHVVSIIGVLYQ